MRDGLDAELAVDAPGKHRRVHTRARDGIIRNSNGRNARCLQLTHPDKEFICISGLRRVKLDSDGLPSGFQRIKKRTERNFHRLDAGLFAFLVNLTRTVRKCRTKRTDMLRRRTAAAADNRDAIAHDRGKTCAEILRSALIECTSVDNDRMPRIRHEGKRQGRRPKMMNQFPHLPHAIYTVKTDGINRSALCRLMNQILGEASVTCIAAGQRRERGQDEGMGAYAFDVCCRLDQALN